MKVKGLLTVTAMMCANMAMAYPLSWGDDITVNDRNLGNGQRWSTGSRDPRIDQFGQRTREDNEVDSRFGRLFGWDAEGIFLKEKQLTFVSGFKRGFFSRPSSFNFGPGDLFIDVDGTTGNGSYDFVFDIDWGMKSYNVFSLDQNSVITETFISQISGTGPWQYQADKNQDQLITSGNFDFDYYSRGEIDEYFKGRHHYAASGFDLSFLGDSNFFAHWTTSYGADSLKGVGAIDVPEPDSVIMFAFGLLGLGLARRQIRSQG